ncbi:MAG TPA: hypothetical protein VM118_12375 [Acidobacteriota bacterium]|nr:hypothetical protein [Acidobacteriota bacterium]
MEHHRPVLSLFSRPSRSVASVAILVLGLTAATERSFADPLPGADRYPSHRAFVLDHLDTIARDVLGEFPFQRGRPLRIRARVANDADSLVEAAFGHAFMDAGFLLMPSGRVADTTRWNLYYDPEQYDLSLTDPTRHSFLGRIWVQRRLEIQMQLELWDAGDEDLLWTHRIDTTFQDWIPKRETRQMAEPEIPLFSPAIPSTTLERLGPPFLVGTLAASLTILVLVLR